MGSIPELGRSPGGGHGNPLQYSCLENPMVRGAWQAIVHRVAELDTTEAIQHAHKHNISVFSSIIIGCINFELFIKYPDVDKNQAVGLLERGT